MCARQHTFHSRGSLLPTRGDTDGVPRIPLWNLRLPISVLGLTKNEVVGGESSLARQVSAVGAGVGVGSRNTHLGPAWPCHASASMPSREMHMPSAR